MHILVNHNKIINFHKIFLTKLINFLKIIIFYKHGKQSNQTKFTPKKITVDKENIKGIRTRNKLSRNKEYQKRKIINNLGGYTERLILRSIKKRNLTK